MPELPDIEAFRKYLEKETVGKPVHRTTVHDKRILNGDLTTSSLGRRLKSSSNPASSPTVKLKASRKRKAAAYIAKCITSSKPPPTGLPPGKNSPIRGCFLSEAKRLPARAATERSNP